MVASFFSKQACDVAYGTLRTFRPNKMARIVWALLVKQENYRAPVAAKA